MDNHLKRQKDDLALDPPTTDILTETASEYVSGLLRQEGLYVGLGLGAVAGGRQRGMVTPCASMDEADSLFNRLPALRLRRGYKIIDGESK